MTLASYSQSQMTLTLGKLVNNLTYAHIICYIQNEIKIIIRNNNFEDVDQHISVYSAAFKEHHTTNLKTAQRTQVELC